MHAPLILVAGFAITASSVAVLAAVLRKTGRAGGTYVGYVGARRTTIRIQTQMPLNQPAGATLLTAACAIAANREPGVNQAKPPLILRNATLVNSRPPYRREHVTVRVQGDSIADVSPAGPSTLPDGANVIDCTGPRR